MSACSQSKITTGGRETALPEVTVFESGLEWLQPQDAGEEVGIGRLLLTDRETLMVSSVNPHVGTDETAVWDTGSTTGCWCSLGGSSQLGWTRTAACGQRMKRKYRTDHVNCRIMLLS